MEQRKLIKLGNSSFAIALPKEWIDKSGLKKGDNIFVERNNNGELIISSNFKKVGDEKVIDINILDKDEIAIRREIRAAYVNGYNVFNLLTGENTNKNEVKNILNELLSVEIVTSNEGKIVAKDFFNLEEANIKNFIRRMDNNIREMLEVISSSIKKGSITSPQCSEIENIDKDVNKFYLLSSRVFIKGIDNPSLLNSLKTTPILLFNNWWFSFNLEAIGDEVKRMAKIIKNMKIGKDEMEKVVQVINLAVDNYTKCMEAFYKEDCSLAENIADDVIKIGNKIEKLIKEEKAMDVRFLEKINIIIKSTYQIAKVILYLKI